MNVLHLIKALGRGGAEVLLAEGLAVADRERFRYTYGYLQSRPDDVAEDLRAQGARVECFHLNGNLQMLLGARRVARYLREQNIDLVHAHLPMAGVVARLAGRMAGVPVVYTEHSPVERYHYLVRRLNILTGSWQRQAIAISDDVAASMRRHVDGTVPISVVWNGVNTRRFAPGHFNREAIRSEFDIPIDVPLVGTVAVLRDSPAKRLDMWMEAAAKVHQMMPAVHFLVVGGGPLLNRLEAQAADLGISSVVHFAGAQSDVRPYLASMDVFMMSSSYEGFGIALAEAMSMQIAVAATDVEGVRNIVSSGKTGLLCAFDEDVADGLAESVVVLINDEALRDRMAAAARKEVIDRFSIDRMQRELEAIYGRVLSNNRHGAVA